MGKTNPKRTQYEPNQSQYKPNQSQNKPNTNPISRRIPGKILENSEKSVKIGNKK